MYNTRVHNRTYIATHSTTKEQAQPVLQVLLCALQRGIQYSSLVLVHPVEILLPGIMPEGLVSRY
jgi:hypothetical protein